MFFNTNLCNSYIKTAASATPHVKAYIKLINYPLLRNLINNAARKTELLTKKKLSVILPYGFELIPTNKNSTAKRLSFPKYAQRHYPLLGIYGEKDHEPVSNCFQAIFLQMLAKDLPEFYANTAAVWLHGFGYYLSDKHKQIPVDKMHIFAIQTAKLLPKMTALDHYANYIVTLFGVFPELNPASPQQRDFEISALRRRRFFQEYIMCEGVMSIIYGALLPDMAPSEKNDFQKLFVLMRNQNILELLPTNIIQSLPASAEERSLVQNLVRPRTRIFRELLLKENGKLKQVESIAYYNGNELLKVILPEVAISKIVAHVKYTYEQFPHVYKTELNMTQPEKSAISFGH